MEEFRRFFRYVIPGLVFIIEVLLYTYLSTEKYFIEFIKRIPEGNKIIELLLTVFFMSGAIGYLLGVVYHFLSHITKKYFHWWIKIFPVTDHLSLIMDVIKRKRIVLKDRKTGNYINPASVILTQNVAWYLITIYMNTRTRQSSEINAALQRLKGYGDLMHGAGTNFVGAAMAIITWLLIRYYLLKCYVVYYEFKYCSLEYYSCFSVLYILLFSILICWLYLFNYSNITKEYEFVANTIFSNEMGKEIVVMNISKDDLDKKKKT